MRGRLGAALWMLCVQFFVAEQVVSRAWAVPYSFTRNYVSDLGAVGCGVHDGLAVCSPLHGWMNASFVLQGLLIAGGALLLRRMFATGRGYSVGLGLLVVAGAGVLVVGLAPEDVHSALHVSGAVAHFVCGGAGMVVLGVTMARDAQRSTAGGWFSVGLGVAVLAATALLGLPNTAAWSTLGWQVGVVERVPAYAIPLWLAAMGAVSVKQTLR